MAVSGVMIPRTGHLAVNAPTVGRVVERAGGQGVADSLRCPTRVDASR